MENRSRRVGRSGWNLVASSTGETAVRVAGLAYLLLLARYLQPASFGAFNILLSYFGIALAIGNFGLDRLMLRQLSSEAWEPRSFNTLFVLRLSAGTGAGLFLLCFGYVASPAFSQMYPIAALAILPASVSASFTAAFQARERFDVPAIAAAAGATLMVLLTSIGVRSGAPITFFITAFFTAEIARSAVLAFMARRRGLWPGVVFDCSYARWALRAALPYGVLALLGALYFRIDLVMLDAMIGGAPVGHYAGAYRVFELAAGVPVLIMSVLFPRFARLQKNDMPGARNLYLAVSRMLFWIGVVTAGVGLSVARPGINLMLAGSYAEAVPVFSWFMVALFFLSWHAPNVTVLFAGDRFKLVIFLSFITLTFNVIANWIMIPRFAAPGAAAATAISEILSFLLFTPVVCGRLGISVQQYFRRLGPPLLSRQEFRLIFGKQRLESASIETKHDSRFSHSVR